MQKIDRKMLDLIVEARRLRGPRGLRKEAHGQGPEPQSITKGDPRNFRPELAQSIAGIRRTHFA